MVRTPFSPGGAEALAVLAALTLGGTFACDRTASPPDSPAPTAAATEDPEAELDDEEDGEDSIEPAALPGPVVVSANPLLSEADRELSRVRATSYEHHTHVDEAAGAYAYDCSGFLGYALSRAAPDAFAAVRATATRRPRSKEYVTFLMAIPAGARAGRWQRVGRAADLQPGDVVTWLKPPGSRSKNTGHTMIVHGAPSPEPGNAGAWVVPVVDSTGRPHGAGDARGAAHATGLGQGEIVLVTDGAGAPVAYRWSRGRGLPEKATTIALGRVR